MKHIYEQEVAVAKALATDVERLTYLSAVFRSLMQALSIVSIEAIRELTPFSPAEANLTQLIPRFTQPSEGLYGEILEVAIPSIRSHATKNYMVGWFEVTEGSHQCFSKDLNTWVQFRNKKPAHGVLSRADAQIWTPRLIDLTERALRLFSSALPVIDGAKLRVSLGDSDFNLATPLIYRGRAIVVGGITSRKGIWKLNGQFLNVDVSDDVTLDLPSDTVFDVGVELGSLRFDLKDVEVGDRVQSVYYNVPVRQTDTFEGRTKELDTLKEWMEDEDTRFCLIYGDGGFGKTTLALEFLNRLLEGEIEIDGTFPSVISYYSSKMTRWTSDGLVHFKGVSDAMEDSIRELLLCLYPVIEKKWYQVSGAALIDKVAGELAEQKFKRDDVLLVLDNTETLATSPEKVEELSDFLKKAGKKVGRILITSRRREFLPATGIQVAGLSDAEALRLMRRLGNEYAAVAINQAGDPRLRQVCAQLNNKPLLIDTLVKYIARSGSGIDGALEQILRKTSDELLEFLYQDAWMRIDDLRRKVFLILVSLACPIDGRCIGDACQEVGLQHVDFQTGLDETYFVTTTDRGTTYDVEIVELAKQFFLKQLQRVDAAGRDEIKRIAGKVDKQALHREQLERAYVRDRVADAFRSQYAKAAKIAVDRRDFGSADESFKLALLEEPMNAALKDRYAWFLSHILQKLSEALPFAEEAVKLDPKSGDAQITLGLIQYRLGNISAGDSAMDKAMKNGKPQMLCYLRMGIARFYQAKKNPYARDAIGLLKEAELLLSKAEKAGGNDDYYYFKNLEDIRRYLHLVARLRLGINRREVSSKEAPGGART